MKKILLASIMSAACFGSFAAVPADDIEKNVNDLLAKMTLDEKIGQLNQLSGFGYATPMIEQIRNGQVGSILNEVDPETVNKLQREAVENSRLGIPLIFARDVIHGFKTIFPIPLGQAASWNAEVVENGARIAADEASSVGIRWTFSPMLDIARDARWGRIAEGFGEDPYLTSVLGAAMVKGYQGDDLSKPNTMAACAKHFAGYGAAEGGRDYNTTWIPDVLLRDVYLPPFKAASDAGAATFMCSFNDINGVPSSGNRHLLRDILRDEWGFDGVMVSDWGSIQQMIPHGYSADLRQAALQSANAGVDIDMEGYAYIQHLKDLVESGELDIAVIDDLVANVLRLKYRLGLFDNPYVDLASSNRFYGDENLKAAREAVEKSAILLGNNGVLPLGKNVKKIAVVGPMADAQHDQAGTWVFDLEKEHSVTPLAALRDRYGKNNVFYAPGTKYSRDKSHDGFAEALKAAEKADVILFFAGEEAVLSGEAHCRTDITLPGAQTDLIKELKATGKPIVLVIEAGRPLALSDIADDVDALVYCFHGGTMTGPGLANLLAGDVNFSGRCPVSFPRTSGQVPIYYNHKNTGRPASGMVFIDDIELEAGQTSTGCTSFYMDAYGDGALFPFGYGLSYTNFEYTDPELSAAEINPDGTLTVTCTVTNTGKREGTETAQLYIRDHVASLIRPVRELRGYKQLTLKPGESQQVTFTIDPEMLKFYVDDNTRVLEPGEFSVWIAPSSNLGNPATFNLVASK